jgi:hypothetical protein
MKILLTVILVQILTCDAQNHSISGLGERRPSPTPSRSIFPSVMTTILPALPEIVTPIVLSNFTIWKVSFKKLVNCSRKSFLKPLGRIQRDHRCK